jgi:hypothetical protein
MALLAGFLLGGSLSLGFDGAASAAPLTFASPGAETSATEGVVIKTVTRAGVAHRSTRRTARRVYRR